jgi:hypothetical protein
MRTEVLVECPICRRDKWVVWGKKNSSFCYECPDLADSPPIMIPQVIPGSHEAVAVRYVTREVE